MCPDEGVLDMEGVLIIEGVLNMEGVLIIEGVLNMEGVLIIEGVLISGCPHLSSIALFDASVSASDPIVVCLFVYLFVCLFVV